MGGYTIIDLQGRNFNIYEPQEGSVTPFPGYVISGIKNIKSKLETKKPIMFINFSIRNVKQKPFFVTIYSIRTTSSNEIGIGTIYPMFFITKSDTDLVVAALWYNDAQN